MGSGGNGRWAGRRWWRGAHSRTGHGAGIKREKQNTLTGGIEFGAILAVAGIKAKLLAGVADVLALQLHAGTRARVVGTDGKADGDAGGNLASLQLHAGGAGK